MPRPCVLILLAFFAALNTSESPANGYPLFSSDETLELVLEAPMRALLRTARKNPVLDGRLRYIDSNGRDVTIDLTITTRGHSRLDLCSFPPLSVSLKKKQTPSTLFAGQHKLKIVSHCKAGSNYQRYFHQEYGIYRAYNVLTDHAFRVRMLDITFRDTEKKRRDEIVPAFFIESGREVAERLNLTEIKTQKISPSQFNVEETNKYELFQYMVGNTDWSILKGPSTENCCHNGKVIGQRGSHKDWVVLPYDFDQSGIINTEYSLPSEQFSIRNVRQRLYRGRCSHNEQLDSTIALFNENRSALEAALTPQALTERSQKKALNYLGAFFETINDENKLNKQVIDKCRGKK